MPPITKAFTLTELVAVIFILTVLSNLMLDHVPDLSYDDEIFISEYHTSLAKAMANQETVVLENEMGLYDLRFNQNGTINEAKTMKGKKGDLIAHLGSSYLTYEN